MKIWTTYFANLKNIDLEKIQPVSICGKPIDGWKYPQYKKLAPSWSIYSELKLHGGTEENYTRRYMGEILGSLDQEVVRKELEALAEGKDEVVLVCYEKPGDFCHRHLVAEWLGEDVKEYESN